MTKKIMNILFKRPVITILCVYVLALIILNYAGFFAPKKQSELFNLAENSQKIAIEGKVITEPEFINNRQKFVLKTSKEKILVLAPSGYVIKYGDIAALTGRLSLPQNAYFPLVFDYRQYLALDEIYSIFTVTGFEYIKSQPNPIIQFAQSVQNDISQKIELFFAPEIAAVLKPLVIGDKSGLNEELKNNFIDAGLMHILVVSGMNVGFIAVIFIFLFKCFGLPYKQTFLSTIPMLFLYALVAGANPPIMRAAIMSSCVLIALSLDREPLIYNSLALSALIILLFQPQQLFGASFQLSYAATIGIIRFYPKVYGLFGHIRNPVLKIIVAAFAVTLSAQILILPLSMFYFGKVSLVSFITNILAAYIVAIALAGAIAFYIFSFISLKITAVIAFALTIPVRFLLDLTTFSGSLKYASVLVAKPTILQIGFYYAFIFSASYFKDKKRLLICAIILIINLFYIVSRPKIFFNFYETKYITTVHFKIDKDYFVVIGKTNSYYERAFKEFKQYSGIKDQH